MAEDRMLNDEILLGLIKANAGGGGGGTPNYNLLENKPQIAGTELQGNKSLADLGIASAQSVSNITNGESINDFAGVENALEGKQNALTAGIYIQMDNGVISVKRDITQTAQTLYYHITIKSNDNYINVEKTKNGVKVSDTEYNWQAVTSNPANVDDCFTISTSGTNWVFTNLIASTTQPAGYAKTLYKSDPRYDYSTTYVTTVDADKKLIIKSELDDAMATKQDALTFDNTPTDGSNNPVKSNGIYDSEKDIYAAMGEMGAKNLIPYPYYESSHIDHDVTFTDNGDGTITADGTASGNALFGMRLATENFVFAKGKYTLSQPQGASRSTYRIYIDGYVNGSYSKSFITGVETSFEITESDVATYTSYAISLVVYSGTTINNITIAPMIRYASDTDSTYQPYAKTNKQLTDDVALLESGKANTDMVAADFDAATSYTAGNYCVQDGKLYKFKNNHSGAWSSSDVDEVKIAGELASLKSGLTNLVKSETMTVTTDSSGGASFDLPSGGTILVSIRPLRDADYYNLWWGVTIGSRAYNSGYGFKAIKDDGTALASQAIKFDVYYI